MIDIKKVREALNDYENNANIVYEAIDELERLQKKEVAMKVRFDNDYARCPNCYKAFYHICDDDIFRYQVNHSYCSNCGQKLDFGDE